MRIAAIDQGTTSTRVVVCGENEPPRIAWAVRHAQHYPQPGWVEHDPEELLANIRACLAAAGPVDAVALTNQGESCLAWDAVLRAVAAGGALLEVASWPQEGQAQYALDGGVYNAGSAIEWARRIGLFTDDAELAAFASPPAIDRGLVFVPALSGLASPHWDRRAAGLWLGLRLDTDRSDLVQAVLEGIALRTAEVVAAMAQRQPLSGPISVDGGLTRSPYFVAVLASALQRPLLVQGFEELTAFGAAAVLTDSRGIVLRPAAEPARRVESTWPAVGWLDRFAEARRRAQQWR